MAASDTNSEIETETDDLDGGQPAQSERPLVPSATLSRLDALNKKIVAMLQVDGRRSFSSIARELGISEGAVRARVNHLQDQEHLRFLAVIDPVHLGYNSWAMLGIKVVPGVAPNDVASYFASLPEAIWVMAAAGRFDLLVEVWTETPVELNKFLEEHCYRTGKIASVETMVGLRLFKWG